MLLNTLLYVALLAVASMTFLSAGLAMARLSTIRVAQTYLTTGYQRAVASLQQSVATQIASSGSAYPLPVFTPLPSACAGTGTTCAYKTAATIAIASLGAATPSPGCDPSNTACVTNEEANPYISEGRLPARISVVVTSASGTQLASRTSDLLLRTLATPPYVIVTSGEDGGTPAATPNPCAPSIAGTADDTTIRVAYQNTASNACTDGSAWRSSTYNVSGTAPAGWSP